MSTGFLWNAGGANLLIGLGVGRSLANPALDFIAALPADNGATVGINAIEPDDRTAPHGIYLEANSLADFDITPNSGSGFDPAWGQIEYVWEVTGVDLGDYPAWNPIPDTFRNRNLQFGPKAGFCLDQPGSYTITVWAVDRSGNIASASITRTILGPADEYPTTQTGVVSFASDFSGKPAGATEISSLSALNTFLGGATTASQRRVLFRRGESFSLSSAINCAVGAGGNCMIGSSAEFGTGATPILTTSGNHQIFSSQSSSNVKLHDLELRPVSGGYDPAADSGTDVDTPIDLATAPSGTPPFNLWHNIGMQNFAQHTYSTSDAFYSVMSNVRNQEWGGTANDGYGFYFTTSSANSRRALVGCAMMQAPDSYTGAGYGPYRDPFGNHLTMSACFFFSQSAPGGSIHQPAMRVNTDNSALSRATFDRCVFEGGADIFVQNENSAVRASQDCNILCDGCIFILTETSGAPDIKIENTGMIFRNCLIYSSDKAPSNPIFVLVEGSGTSSDIYSDPIELYNNSIVFPNSSGWNGDIYSQNGAGFSNITDQNNIAYGSSGDSLQGDGALDLSTALAGLVPQGSLGSKRATGGGAQSGNTTASLFPTCIPVSGSGAENDEEASSLTAYFDIFRKVRASPVDRGASEIA